MKKILAIVMVVSIVLLCSANAFAYDNEALMNELDHDYYGRFKDQNISINVYNWGVYISDGEDDTLDVNEAFEELTGIKVNYSNYATNEELYAKLKAGGSSYDVIIPSEYMIAKMAAEGMLAELDKSNIPNFKYINPTLLDMDYDKGNTYSIPYTWGTVVIIYNKEMVSADTDVETWGLLWDEKYKDNVLMFNNPRDAYGIALKKLNKGINPTSQEDVDAATEELKKQRSVVQAYVMDEIFDKMGAGEAAIAPYYAGDAITMMADNPSLNAVFPREGTNIFVDALCIPKGSQQKEAAEMYLNFMMEPKVAAANAETIGYSTPNTEAIQYLSPEMRESKIAYPDEEVIKKAEYFVLLPNELNTALDNGWKDLLTEDEGFTFWLVPGILGVIVVISIILVVRRNKKKNADY